MDRTGDYQVNELSKHCVFSLSQEIWEEEKKGVELSGKRQDAEGEGRLVIKSERRDHVIEGRYTCGWKRQRETPHFIQLTCVAIIWNNQTRTLLW